MTTWEELVAHEPRLNDLLDDALAVPTTDRRFCRHRVFVNGYQGGPSFQARLEQLLGWHAPHRGTFLASSEAFDVGRRTILEALPGCRNCGCVDWEPEFIAGFLS